jgi:hypothetical protein
MTINVDASLRGRIGGKMLLAITNNNFLLIVVMANSCIGGAVDMI